MHALLLDEQTLRAAQFSTSNSSSPVAQQQQLEPRSALAGPSAVEQHPDVSELTHAVFAGMMRMSLHLSAYAAWRS